MPLWVVVSLHSSARLRLTIVSYLEDSAVRIMRLLLPLFVIRRAVTIYLDENLSPQIVVHRRSRKSR